MRKPQVYLVYRNGELCERITGTKRSAKLWVAANVTSTHMGSWRKAYDGYRYDTTIGVYYAFVSVDAK